MLNRMRLSLPLLGTLFVVLCLPLAGCGGTDSQPQGPEVGELERYMAEHPELMDTEDEEMDQIEGDEFADVD